MQFVLENPQFDFFSALHLELDAGTVFEVRIGVSRANQPRSWENPMYRVELQGRTAVIRFLRPNNWPKIRVEVVGEGLSNPRVAFAKVPTLSAEQITQKLAQRSIVFLGCARNCATNLHASVVAISRLRMLFAGSEFHVFENDSTDVTRSMLEQYQSHGLLSLHSRTGLDAILPRRTERLAFARNFLMDIAVSRATADYVCLVDLDGTLDEHFPVERFLSCFNYEEAWDAVFPCIEGFYYDVWALRHPTMWPGDYNRWMNATCDMALGARGIINMAVRQRQIDWTSLSGWLPVDSAFGGMGLYKAAACRNGRYVGIEDDAEACEHVLFHQMLREQGARLFINPQFRVRCPDFHANSGVAEACRNPLS